MSYYDDDRRGSRARSRSRGGGSRAVARRGRDSSSESSVEEIRRDFGPGDRGYYKETTVRQRGSRPVRSRSVASDRYYDDRYDERSPVDRRSRGGYRDRDSAIQRFSSSGSDRSTRSRRDRRKSSAGDFLGGLGLGGVVGALTGKHQSRSRSRGRRYSSGSESDRPRSSSRRREQIAQALKASLVAGVGTAIAARHDPGTWGGEKGKRVLTAAVTASVVDGLLTYNKNPEKHSKRDIIGAAIAGIAADRFVNKPKAEDPLPPGAVLPTERGRSISRPGRSTSRGRGSSAGSNESRGPPRRRGSSVSGLAGRGLAAVGLHDAADRVDPSRRGPSPGQGYYNNSREVGTPSNPGTVAVVGAAGPPAVNRAPPNGYQLDYGPHKYGDPETDSESDLGSSGDEEKEKKKGRKKLFVSTGLAAIATIHAGHSVYQGMEKREARRKAVKTGEITKEQADKMRNKTRLQDAASVGIAALGMKGAFSEWNEMREEAHEHKEEMEKMERHRRKREARRMKYDYYRDKGMLQPHHNLNHSASMPNLHQEGGHPQQNQGPPPPPQQGQGYYPSYSPSPPNGYAGHYATGQPTHHYENPGYVGNRNHPPLSQQQAPPGQQPYFPPPPVGNDHYPPV